MTRHVVTWSAYSTAHVGKSLLWAASDLLTLYVLVTLYAMAPTVAGALFLVSLAANAVADLGVGIWLDRHPQHASALAAGALMVSAASFPATMLLAPYGTGAVLAAMMLFRIAYAGYDVPHNALMARLAPDPGQAAWLSRGRTIGTGIAGFVVAYSARGLTDAAAIAPVLWMLAGAALVIGLVLIPLLRREPLAMVPLIGGVQLALPTRFLIASVVGIVALGALAKAVLHAPPSTAAIDPATMLILLTAGRTASALIPLRIVDARRGLALLGAMYLASAAVAGVFSWSVAAPALLMLGLAMGLTNLIGWALLPALARGAKGFGLYTMVSKLGLGTAGVALAAGLGRAPIFSEGTFAGFAAFVSSACVGAAILFWLGLTSPARGVFSQR